MFAQIEYPEKLLPEELDNYLSKGWFRMRQTIFTTNFLHFERQFYSAIWLRVGLNEYIADKKYSTLHKLNNGFRTEIKKCATTAITPEQEVLYLHYRQSVTFDISPSLNELLFGIETFNRFNTHEVNIYDGERLIAAGFFDLGQKSAAGITCIYHPTYKKYSLGKYLMYLKIDFCKQRHLQYFYPGYVVPGCPSFDYKLAVGKATLEYLQLSTQNWQRYIPTASMQNPLKEMHEKLTSLRNHLTKNSIFNNFVYYRFFEANLDPYYYGYELFDFPVFLHFHPTAGSLFYNMVVYDIRGAWYFLLQCSFVINISEQRKTQLIFDSGLLKIERVLFSTKGVEEMSIHLSGFLKES